MATTLLECWRIRVLLGFQYTWTQGRGASGAWGHRVFVPIFLVMAMEFAWVLEFLGWVFEKLLKYQLIVGPIVVGFIAALLIAIATRSKAGSALAGIVAMAITFLGLLIIG